MDKVTSDSAIVAKERNDAVSQLGKELKEIERLESDRRDLFARIDVLERQKSEKRETVDTRNNYDCAIELAQDRNKPEVMEFLKAYTAKK